MLIGNILQTGVAWCAGECTMVWALCAILGALLIKLVDIVTRKKLGERKVIFWNDKNILFYYFNCILKTQ